MEFAQAISEIANKKKSQVNFCVGEATIRYMDIDNVFDGPHYPLPENIRLTCRVVEVAHAAGVSVEGELGIIGGTEDDIFLDEKASNCQQHK